MRDRGAFWSLPPQPGTRIEAPGLSVTLLPPIAQTLVSGDLQAFLAAHDLPAPLGLLEDAPTDRYALRLARNRLLAVGVEVAHRTAGLQGGWAATPATGALAVLKVDGPRSMDLLSRATAIDLRHPSPSASFSFAGVLTHVCRRGDGLHLHLDRGLLAWAFDWFSLTEPFRQE